MFASTAVWRRQTGQIPPAVTTFPADSARRPSLPANAGVRNSCTVLSPMDGRFNRVGWSISGVAGGRSGAGGRVGKRSPVRYLVASIKVERLHRAPPCPYI